MKTKELKDRLLELDFVSKITENDDFISVINLSNNRIGFVSKEIMYDMNTGFWTLNSLGENERKQLFEVLSEYASTPIEDRVEKKLYTATSKINPFFMLHKYLDGGYKFDVVGLYSPDNMEFTEEELKNVNGINLWESNEWLVEEVKQND